MCDVSGKLIAWIDRELPADEAAEVGKHLETCAGCRQEVDAYKRASGEFDAYCDEVIAAEARPGGLRRVPAAAVAVVAAALAALFLLWPRPHVEPVMNTTQRAITAEEPSLVLSGPSEAAVPVHKIHQIGPPPIAPKHQTAYISPSESMIQIAIPGSEMLPPGAVPEGVDFVATLTAAPDGSAAGLRFRPRPAGF